MGAPAIEDKNEADALFEGILTKFSQINEK